MDTTVISGPALITLSNGRKKLKRPKNFNNGLTYCLFARSFAKYVKWDFEATKSEHFGADRKVSEYLDPLDWHFLVDHFEDEFGLKLIDTEAWDYLSGNSDVEKKCINPRLTMFCLFLFISQCETTDGKPVKKGAVSKVETRKPRLLFDPGTSLADKVRQLVANYLVPFQDNWKLLSGDYKLLNFPKLARTQLFWDFEELALDLNFEIGEKGEDAFDKFFNSTCPSVQNLIQLVQSWHTKEIA